MENRDAFVSIDNQTILWDIMQPFLRKYPDFPQPDIWFAAHIGHIYETKFETDLSLLERNKAALVNMMEDVVQLLQQQSSLFQQREQQSQQSSLFQQSHQSQQSDHDISREMSERVDKDAQLRNQSTKDEPIKNMEELLAETQKRRERDLPRFAVPTGDQVDG